MLQKLGFSLKRLIICLSVWGHVNSTNVGLYHAVQISKHDWENFLEAPASPLKAKTHFECALECQSSHTCCITQFDGTTCKLGHELGRKNVFRFPVNSLGMSTENVLMRKEYFLAGESTILNKNISLSQAQCHLFLLIQDYTDQVPPDTPGICNTSQFAFPQVR